MHTDWTENNKTESTSTAHTHTGDWIGYVCDALTIKRVHFLSLHTEHSKAPAIFYSTHINLWVKLSISSQQITYLQINYRVALQANTSAILSRAQQKKDSSHRQGKKERAMNGYIIDRKAPNTLKFDLKAKCDEPNDPWQWNKNKNKKKRIKIHKDQYQHDKAHTHSEREGERAVEV